MSSPSSSGYTNTLNGGFISNTTTTTPTTTTATNIIPQPISTTTTTTTTTTTATNNNPPISTSKIIDAARKGNTELICKLLKKDWKKINKKDEKGDGCLHKAAFFGHADSIEAILKYASNNGLLQQSTNNNISGGSSVGGGSGSSSNSINNQVNINMKNFEGYTPFMYAALNNWKECMRILVSYGADINEKLPSNPGLPLSYSISNGTGVYSWKIENFSKIKERKIQSNTFLVSGFSWKLVAYPRGSKNDDNFSLYLEVANYESLAEGWSHLANFTFTITNQTDPTKKVVREVLAHRFHRNHTDLGFSQILKKEMLKDKKSGWLQSDCLLVEFKIEVLHNSSYQNDETSIYTWKIHNVSAMKDRATSPIFKVGNCKWTIALYPKGKGGGNNLSVYLKVADKSILPIDWFFLVSFKFSLIDQKNGTKFTRQVEAKRFKENVEDWGFPQFMKLSSLYNLNSSSSGFLKAHDDSIIIELQMEIVNDFTKKKLRDSTLEWGLSPLHISSYKGNSEMVKLLLMLGANSNITDAKGRTPLDWCAYNGDLSAAEVLIKIGCADVNCKDNEGYTPLHKSIMNGHLEVARLLVKHGACVNAKNNSKVTPLELAIRVNRLSCVEALIQLGADVNLTDKQGRSPLHWAIFLGDPKLLALLIKYGCSEQIIDTIVDYNIGKIISTTGKNNDNHNIKTVEGGDEVIDNFDPELHGDGPVLLSTLLQYTDIRIHLHRHQEKQIKNKKLIVPLKVNNVDQDGFTPLHKAITRGKCSFVKLLLDKGGDPTMLTKDNRNALHLAVSANEYYIAQSILEHCSGQTNKLFNFDDHNQTPLHKAVINGNMKILELLVNRGASVNCGPNYSPAINEAIKNNDVLCIVYLIQNSAEIDNSPKLLMNLLSRRIKFTKILSQAGKNNLTTSGSTSTSNNDNSGSTSNDNQIPPCTLRKDMLFLVNNQTYKDVTFIVEEKPIYAWKGILCARSDFFRAMFETPLKESSESEIKIESVSYSTFLLVMQYLYTGEVESLLANNSNNNSNSSNNNNNNGSNGFDFDELIQLFIAANRFMVTRLKLACETLIVREYSYSNIYSIFKLIDIYESPYLLNEAVKYLSENFQQISETNLILKMPSFRKSLLDILKNSLRPKVYSSDTDYTINNNSFNNIINNNSSSNINDETWYDLLDISNDNQNNHSDDDDNENQTNSIGD